MGDQIIVSHGIHPAIVSFGQYDCFIGFGTDSVEAYSVGRRKTLLLTAKRNNGDQPDVGPRFSTIQNRFRCGQVESYGHAAQKRAYAGVMQRSDGAEQQLVGFVTIGAVSGESGGSCR